MSKKVFFISAILFGFMFLQGCAPQNPKFVYVIETSNALEKEGKEVEKVQWKWDKFKDVPVRVKDKFTGEIALKKGYNPMYTGDRKHFYVYGIIEKDRLSETYMYMRFDARFYRWENLK